VYLHHPATTESIQRRRQDLLTGATSCASELERLVSLAMIDDLWAEFLATGTDLREGVHWVSWGGRDPLYEYLRSVHSLFEQLQARIEEEIPKRLEEAEAGHLDPTERGATWTCLTTDQPFGSWNERIMRGIVRKFRARSVCIIGGRLAGINVAPCGYPSAGASTETGRLGSCRN
jgi:hypothetical protein